MGDHTAARREGGDATPLSPRGCDRGAPNHPRCGTIEDAIGDEALLTVPCDAVGACHRAMGDPVMVAQMVKEVVHAGRGDRAMRGREARVSVR
ncbi:MAG: hypothetical protein EBS20_00425 [Actinobacteria bacterium]|nr:hypothetical protein [Actinomycetota bacterium]